MFSFRRLLPRKQTPGTVRKQLNPSSYRKQPTGYGINPWCAKIPGKNVLLKGHPVAPCFASNPMAPESEGEEGNEQKSLQLLINHSAGTLPPSSRYGFKGAGIFVCHVKVPDEILDVVDMLTLLQGFTPHMLMRLMLSLVRFCCSSIFSHGRLIWRTRGREFRWKFNPIKTCSDEGGETL